MINETKKGDIFKTDASYIAFPINAEGAVGDGFDGQIIKKGWPELVNVGPQPIGTVLSKKIEDKTYFALVCYSLEEEWGTPEEQRKNIKKCFDNIPINKGEKIASNVYGTEFLEMMSGANPKQIICGMCDSDKDIILYNISLEQVKQIYDENPCEE